MYFTLSFHLSMLSATFCFINSWITVARSKALYRVHPTNTPSRQPIKCEAIRRQRGRGACMHKHVGLFVRCMSAPIRPVCQPSDCGRVSSRAIKAGRPEVAHNVTTACIPRHGNDLRSGACVRNGSLSARTDNGQLLVELGTV